MRSSPHKRDICGQPLLRAAQRNPSRIYLPVTTMIPLRNFGKNEIKISALGLGGHHLGAAKDEATAVEIVQRAIDGGITFYDNCWEYNRGKSEDWLGKGLRGVRDRAFVMSKVCTHGRDALLAMQMLEQSLRRLQTDHLDLWGTKFAHRSELYAALRSRDESPARPR
jgi:aryl-alcohol dehydrogenase-like predicted oxidoreductase